MVLGFSGNSKSVYRVWDFVKKKIYTASNLSFREDIKAYPNFGPKDTIISQPDAPDLFGNYYENFEDIPEIEHGNGCLNKGNDLLKPY